MRSSRLYKMIAIAFILIVLSLAGYFYYDFVNTPIDIGIDEIGKQYTIVIEESEIRDYRRLAAEDFELLKDDEVDKLKDHMIEENLIIDPGEYLVNQIYMFDDLIRTFRFSGIR